MYTSIILALGLISLGWFIYRYARYSPWKKTFQGRTLMSQKVAWFLLVLHFLVESFVFYPFHNTVEHLIITLCVILFWCTLWGLLVAQGAPAEFRNFYRKLRGMVPAPHPKTSRKRGTGYVDDKDIEKTRPKAPRVR